MFEEKNKATLQQAIRRLPVYEPDAWVWEKVNEALEQLEGEAGLQKSLRRLPVYTPPESVWSGIAAELKSESQPREAKIRPLYRRLPRTAAAAAVALLLAGLTWLLLPDSNAARETIVRTEVTLPDIRPATQWNEDESVFQTVRAQFAEHPLLRRHPNMQRLNRELEELSAAKAEIQAAMNSYGRDPDLIRQIGAIERERSDVLKRMVALN